MMPNKTLQPTVLPSLRYGKTAAELGRWAAESRAVTHARHIGVSMSSSHKPINYNTVSPYLIVDGANGTIDFLVSVFGAVELRRFPDAAGKLMHAEVRIDDTVLMVADGGDGWPPVPSYVHVYVSDVDATYKRALEAGATSVQEPVKKEDEDKRGGVKDAGGTTWWIATKVA